MKYDWEKHVTNEIICLANEGLPDDLEVIGLVVRNTETIEAAIITHPPESLGDVADADIWSDILGDAKSKYQTYRGIMAGNTSSAMMKKFGHAE